MQAYLTSQIKRLKNQSPGQPFDLISAEGSWTAPYCPLFPSSSLDGRGADWSFSADVLYASVNLEAAESFSPLSLSESIPEVLSSPQHLSFWFPQLSFISTL